MIKKITRILLLSTAVLAIFWPIASLALVFWPGRSCSHEIGFTALPSALSLTCFGLYSVPIFPRTWHIFRIKLKSLYFVLYYLIAYI